MSSSKGISFSLGGARKRASSARAPAPRPAPRSAPPVADIFADDSDGDEEAQEPKKARHDSSGDTEVRHVADKLAAFVAKNGRSFEEVTRQRNPGDTPFRFLFDKSSPEYLYYDAKVQSFQDAAAKQGVGTKGGVEAQDWGPSSGLASSRPAPPAAQTSTSRRSRFSDAPSTAAAAPAAPVGPAAPATTDSIAAMNAYMKQVAKKEETQKPKDEESGRRQGLLNDTPYEKRRTYAVFRQDGSRGHHMQDFIPPEEMAKFMAKCNDSGAKTHADQLNEKSKIGADNIGHKLLSKMGWKEGEGLGAAGGGTVVPVERGSVKQDNLGVGARAVGEVSEQDDMYDQYRKRMMLGYKHRPNPLGNPRRAYY